MKTILIFLSISFLIASQSVNTQEQQQSINPYQTDQRINQSQCHYSCLNCTDTSQTSCLECSDPSRGYGGIPGYRNTCYCLDDYYESFTTKCDSYDSENQTLDVIIAIALWIMLPSAFIVAAFGNQFMGYYCIDTIQVMGYYYYVSQMFPSTIHNSLYFMRYYSFSNFNTIMRSSFLEKYIFSLQSESITKEYVIIEQQVLSHPKYTYCEIPANFIYNGTIHLIVIFCMYLVFGILLICYIKYPQQKDSFLTKVYKARKTITLRIFQFFVGDLFLFACIQCTNIVFTTPLGSMGFILSVLVFLLLWVGFAYGFYLLNMSKVKFEDKENQVFFNKLKKNDKINRNFFILQIINKIVLILFLVIFMNSYDVQITAVAIIATIFSLVTVTKIKLKKKRHNIFLMLVNVCKLVMNLFMIMFAYSSSDVKITAGWLFEVSAFVSLLIMIIYLFIELTSQLPDIIMFLRQISCLDCLRQKSQSLISLEMQQCNYLSQTKSFQNQIYNYFDSEASYQQVVNEYLDKYTFEMPEEDENEPDDDQDNENPENVEIQLNQEMDNQQNDNDNQEDYLKNEFDPEEYLKQANE